MNSLSFSRIHSLFHGFCIYFANKLWKYFLFREYAIKLLFSRLTFNFAKTIWLSYLLRKFTTNLLRVSRFTMNFLFIFRIFYESTIYFANLLWIHNLYRGFIKDPLSVYTIYLSNIPRIHYLFCELTLDSQSI